MADDEVLERIRRNFHRAESSEAENRARWLADLKLSVGEDSWAADARARRENDPGGPRSCLNIPRVPGSVHQVTNEIRRNTPSALVSAVDNYADVDTAQVISGLFRHIHRQSNADAVRAYAGDHAVRTGRGCYRIVTEYSSPMSFDQEIFLRRIKHQFSVYADPSAQMADYSDMKWCFINTRYSREAFREEFPASETAEAIGMGASGLGDADPSWMDAEGVTVGEYFEVQYTSKTLVETDSGWVGLKDSIPAGLSGVEIIDERETRIPKVVKYVTTGNEIIKKSDWPGMYIPVLIVNGEEVVVDGETRLIGLPRHAHDSQRMYDYWASAATDILALASKAQYFVTPAQTRGFEDMWETMNTTARPYIYVNPDTEAPGWPQRQQFEPAVQAVMQARGAAADDLKATMSIYDASLGNRSNETSGIAIRERKVEGDTANFHFSDNLEITIQHEARIMLDLICNTPIYAKPGRVQRIIGENQDQRLVKLNQAQGEKDRRIFAVGTGRYDVAVSVGPSASTQRQEAAAFTLEAAKVDPSLFQKAGDVIFGYRDEAGSQEIAKRYKKTMPPELMDEEGGSEQALAIAQAKVKQLEELRQALTEALNDASEIIKNKRLELESRERIEAMKAELAVLKMAVELDSKEATVMLQAQLAELNQRQALLNEDQPVVEAQTNGSGNATA